MKFKISLLFSFLFLALSLTGQEITFSVKTNTTSFSSTGGNNYQLIGTVIDDNGVWSAADVVSGDSLFYIEESIIYPFIINSKTSSGSVITAQITSVGTFISNSPSQSVSGQVAISRKNSKGYCAVPAGLQNPLSWALENRFKAKLATDVTDATDVYAYLGGAGVLPSVSPPAITQYLARNGANELYQWNGTTWVLVGSGSLTANSVDSTHIKVGGIAASDAGQSLIDTIKKLNPYSIVPLIVQFGESNSGGVVPVSQASSAELLPNPKVRMFNNNSRKFETFQLGVNNLINHQSIVDNTQMSFENYIAFNVARFKDTIYYLKSGQGSSNSTQWLTNGNYFDSLQTKMREAITLIKKSGKQPQIHYILSFGVNDGTQITAGTANYSPALFRSRVEAIFSTLEKEFGRAPVYATHIPTPSSGQVSIDSTLSVMGVQNTLFHTVYTADATQLDQYHWDYDGQKLVADRLLTAILDSVGTGVNYNTAIQKSIITEPVAGSWAIGGNNLSVDETIGTKSNNEVQIITNNIGRVRVMANGNVGIGTQTPLGKLHVGGDVLVTNSGGLYVDNYASGITVKQSGNMEFRNGAAIKAVLTPTGNFGINVATPLSKLHVGGDILLTNTGGIYSENFACGLTMRNAGGMTFYNGAAIRMTLLATGELGINTTIPLYKLDIDANTGSAGNPIRLRGLQAGASTDSIISSQSGVLKRLSISQVTQASVTSTMPYGTLTVGASPTTTIVVPITNSVTPLTTTDITHIQLWYQPLGTGAKSLLVPTVDFTLNSISGNNVTLTVGSTPATSDKFYILIK